MQKMSHSLHVSSKGHSIKTTNDLRSVDSHNNRKFEKSNNENLDSTLSNLNTTLIGSDNISNDVTNLYTELFDSSVKEFNARQKNKDRICNDYMQKVANSQQQFIAEEIIVQLGSSNEDDVYLNFLKNNDLTTEQKEKVHGTLKDLYSDYLNELQTYVPNFKVANATLHMDETNPHLHIVGVPISENNKRGMKTKVSKGRVFTQSGLSEMQDYMGERMEELVLKHFSLEVEHKKSEGKNKNLTPKEIKQRNEETKLYNEKIATLKAQVNQLEKEKQEYNKFRTQVEFNMEVLIEQNNEILEAEERLELENQQLNAEFEKIEKQQELIANTKRAIAEVKQEIDDDGISVSEKDRLFRLSTFQEGRRAPAFIKDLSTTGKAIAYTMVKDRKLVLSKEQSEDLKESYKKTVNRHNRRTADVKSRARKRDNGLEL